MRNGSIAVVAACFLGLSLQAIADDGYASVSQQGAVATVHPLATQAGMAAFERGGNAVDAAIAAALTLGVVDGHNSGIGGGCFALVHWADGRIEALDGREMAPGAARRDMYLRDGVADTNLSQTGPLAVGVPGSLAVYQHLAETGGELTLSDALRAAAKIAEEGFPIDGVYRDALEETADKLRGFAATAAILLDESGEIWPVGHILRQPDLAASYRELADHGIRAFYGGRLGAAIASWLRTNGGIVSLADFANYRMRKRPPVVSQYAGLTIYGFPPPSSGGIHVAQILNILDTLKIDKVSETGRYHLIAEAMKLAFADRAYWLGDSDFVDVPMGLVEPDYAKSLAAAIDPEAATVVSGPGRPPRHASEFFPRHTTHIAAADHEGNWVAITTTVNTTFGSKVIVPGTGIVLNNQMDDFSIQPGVANAFGLTGSDGNAIAPGKRPLSSMSPTLVLDGDTPMLTLGAAGGPMIINQVVQALVNVLALGQPLGDALAAPRIHHQWRPDRLFAEPELVARLGGDFEARGHEVVSLGYAGATQAIRRHPDGHLEAVSEPRVVRRNEMSPGQP